jgi:hypothetical protein
LNNRGNRTEDLDGTKLVAGRESFTEAVNGYYFIFEMLQTT